MGALSRGTSKPLTLLVLDANVLIDLVAVDRTVLGSVARHVGTVIVPSVVLAEVEGLSAEDAVELGLLVVEPEDAHFAEAAA